jgi:hypothetical protein
METDMAELDQFESKFATLKDRGVLPEFDDQHLSEAMKQVINDLTEEEMEFLVRLCQRTSSHLYLHESERGVVVMGL